MDSNTAIKLIKESYVHEIKEPTLKAGRMYQAYLMQYSYSKWDCQEIIRELRKNPDRHPYLTLSDLLSRANHYSTIGTNSIMFSVLCDVLVDFIDLILCSE